MSKGNLAVDRKQGNISDVKLDAVIRQKFTQKVTQNLNFINYGERILQKVLQAGLQERNERIEELTNET